MWIHIKQHSETSLCLSTPSPSDEMRRRLAAESKVAAAEMPVMMSLDYELYTVMAVVDDVKDSKGGVVQEFHLKISAV